MNQKNFGKIFILGVLTTTVIVTFFVWRSLIVTDETFVISLIWLIGFVFLFFNVIYLFFLSLMALFIKAPRLHEVFIRNFPKTALLYPVRNETHGLFERIDYSMSGNRLPGLDLWILSDSDAGYEAFERTIYRRLLEKYPGRVFYRRREVPVERKQGNIQEFLRSNPQYPYIYVADADSMVPKGVVLKLLKKAENPENQDIVIFQCFVRIAHAKSWYAFFEKIGSEFSQRLNFTTLQALFGKSISFGHHQLVRAHIFSTIEVPKGVLSHDNWDTALLDEKKYRVAFCPEAIAYDEAPSHYLESKVRAKRWAQGTLQGWPLIFKSGISFPVRFLIFYGIYLYLADIVFFLWVILGLFIHSIYVGQILNIEVDSIWMNLFTNQFLNGILFFTFAVTFLHKFLVIRSLKEVFHYLYEILFSTLVLLNNFFYGPLNLVSLLFRKLGWKPMNKNPFAELRFQDCMKALWPGTLMGIGILIFCLSKTPYFIWQITPILVSLILSIPLVYLSGKPVPRFVRQRI